MKMTGQRLNFTHFWPIAVFVSVGLLSTIYGASFVQRLEQQNFSAQFEQIVEDSLLAIHTNLEWHIESLGTVAAFYAASTAINRQEFTTFVKPLLQERPGVTAITWIPRVPANQRRVFEAALRQETALQYDTAVVTFTEYNEQALRPARARTQYYPVYYQESLPNAGLPLGFDVGSEPSIAAALNQAHTYGQRVVTDAFFFRSQNPKAPFTIQLFHPIYATGLVTDVPATGSALLLGFVALTLNVDEVIAHTIEAVAPASIHLDLYDLAQQKQLYHYPSSVVDTTVVTDFLVNGQSYQRELLIEKTVEVADQKWHAVLQPTPAYFMRNRPWSHWRVGGGGLLLVGVGTLYLYLILERKHRSELVIREQTAQLHQANQHLQETLHELQFQKTLLECTSEAAQDGILVVSPQREWLFFNRRFLELWQIPMSIATQRSSMAGVDWALTQVQNAEQVKQRIEALYAQPNAYASDEIYFKNGASIERFSAPVKSADGTLFGRVWYYHDITHRKETEEALRQSEARNRALVSAIPDLLFRVDKNGTFLDYHFTSGHLPALAPSEFLARNAVDIFPPATAQALKERIAAVLANGEVKIVEYEMPMLTGELRDWEQRAVMLNEAEVLLIIRDITARKRAEAALQVSQRQLQERQQREKELVEEELARVRKQLVVNTRLATLGQVAATIAHELRNPLGAVRNAVYYIKRYLAQEQPELLDFLQIIDVEVVRADRIITDLLEMTHAKEPGIQPLDLCTIAQEIWHQTKQTERINFSCVVPQEPFWVLADPIHFRQVLANLITNAIQAMADRGDLRITGTYEDDCVIITVQDSGPGVPPTLREQIFEPLFTTKAKGTGLGLAICRQIIERHGGTIELSDGTHGATFVIRLPINPVASALLTQPVGTQTEDKG